MSKTSSHLRKGVKELGVIETNLIPGKGGISFPKGEGLLSSIPSSLRKGEGEKDSKASKAKKRL